MNLLEERRTANANCHPLTTGIHLFHDESPRKDRHPNPILPMMETEGAMGDGAEGAEEAGDPDGGSAVDQILFKNSWSDWS